MLGDALTTACNCLYENNVIVKGKREYNYFGNVLQYKYNHFVFGTMFSSMITITQKVQVRVSVKSITFWQFLHHTKNEYIKNLGQVSLKIWVTEL